MVQCFACGFVSQIGFPREVSRCRAPVMVAVRMRPEISAVERIGDAKGPCFLTSS